MPTPKAKLTEEEVVKLREALARQSLEARRRPGTQKLLDNMANQIWDETVAQGPRKAYLARRLMREKLASR